MTLAGEEIPPGVSRARSIDDLVKTVSASRLSVFHQCRLKFYFRYVLGLTKPKTAALHVGSSVHSTLKHWNKARWKNEQPGLKQLHDVYSQAWSQGVEPVDWDGENEAEEKKTGWRLLETYFRESPIKPDEKPEAVEVNVEADLANHGLPKLIGIIDLVRAGGTIVDFKTSGKTPDSQMIPHLNDTQLASYGVLYREATGKQESGLELHHLVKTKNPKLVVTELPPVDDVQEDRLYHTMESYVEGVQRADWVPSPSFLCASCEFFNECRGWHRSKSTITNHEAGFRGMEPASFISTERRNHEAQIHSHHPSLRHRTVRVQGYFKRPPRKRTA